MGSCYILTIAGRFVTTLQGCVSILHPQCCRLMLHQAMFLWDHVTHTYTQYFLRIGASRDHGLVGPFYTLTIAGRCVTRPSACGTMLHTYYCRSVQHQTKCLWDHATHLLLQVGAAPDQVPVGPCYTLTIAGRCGTRPSPCGTMLHTYYCRSVRHQTKCLWDHVAHLLLQVGAAPDQVPVGPDPPHVLAAFPPVNLYPESQE